MMIMIAVTWQQFMAARQLPALARRWQGFSGKHLGLGYVPRPAKPICHFARDGGQQEAFWPASTSQLSDSKRPGRDLGFLPWEI